MKDIPGHLKGYESLYEKNPRAAALKWFADAGYGLFIHYGLYSLLGRGEWVQYDERIPVVEYAKLKEKFKADAFDAEKIADFAVEGGFKYITFTVRHFEGFCLFDAGQTSFNCVTAPCGRDLLGELADACGKREMGLFLHYSHGRDWRHPHAPNNDQWGGKARPEYDPPDPSYAYGKDHNLRIYVNYVYSQVARLMADYKNIAGICFDGIEVPISGEYELFRCRVLYDLIRELKPHALISYKQGLLGAEDFTSFDPEMIWSRAGLTALTTGIPETTPAPMRFTGSLRVTF